VGNSAEAPAPVNLQAVDGGKLLNNGPLIGVKGFVGSFEKLGKKTNKKAFLLIWGAKTGVRLALITSLS
jgi:hypothetical protein